jgi:hypothetical protein
MESREAAMAREHFFDKDARVARAKQVDESVAGNRIRADLRSAFDGVQLRGFDAVEDSFGLINIIYCSS